MVHFTDWLPTLLAAAGAPSPRTLRLDGIDVLPLLQGERGKTPDERFWQWNRYAPDIECNAAMRDGKWKLVRPAIGAMLNPTREDLAADIDSKYNPERRVDIDTGPVPDLRAGAPAPNAQLFDLEADPCERADLAAREPDRVARMSRRLETWFEEVEAERRTIRD